MALAAALVITAAIATFAPASTATAAEGDGANVALASAGGTVTASGSEGNGSYGWTPEKVIDGITSGPGGQNTSRWSSNYSDSAWITVKLAAPTVIDHVDIHWESACAAQYKLQVSTDGTTWVDATGTVAPVCGTEDTQTIGASADPATAYQHVRMQTIARTPIGGQLYGVSLWELEVWDGPEQAPAAVLPLVPKPVSVEQLDAESFTIAPDSAIVASGDAAGPAELLAEQLRSATGFPIPVDETSNGDGDITLSVDPAADYPAGGEGEDVADEAYLLESSASGVSITGSTGHGVFNGVQTLRQLLPVWAASETPTTTPLTVPAVEIGDAPRFAYRGVMIDVARSFQTVDEIKAQIDTLAGVKMNTLHMHLADDQGWRIEITNDGKAAGDPIDYSKLTDVSGKTAMSQTWYHGEIGHTGYYTQADFAEIVDYARDRHVAIVPEVDVPSHTNAALHAIPELNTARSLPAKNPETGVVPWNGTGSVGYSALDEQHELSYVFVEHVFSQLAEMSGSDYVHIGGDESHDMGHDRFVDFVTQVVPRVRAATGVGTIGWSEYAEAGLSQGEGYWDGSVVQYWIGSGDWVRDFVAKGGKAVVSAAGGSYVDQKYDASTPIGLSWACSGSCDFDRYYDWDPTTTVSGGIPEAGVLGVEAPLWSETVRGGDQSEFLVLPRAISVLETGWTAQDAKNVDDFTQRLGQLGARLTVEGSNYYESARATWDASVAGAELTARTGSEAGWPVGSIAAPGTKLSVDGATIAADTVTSDGDPASRSSITEPVTAQLACPSGTTPIVFTTDQARDPVHGAGLYTATASRTFTAAESCTLETSGGLAASTPVEVGVAADAALPAEPFSPTTDPELVIGDGGADLVAGDWTRVQLDGFEDGQFVELRIDGTPFGSVRTGAVGTFDGYVPIPAATEAGAATVTAVEGTRTAEASVVIDSDVEPLPDLIDQSTLSIADVDSEETVGEDGAAENAIDGDPATFWHTQWQGAQPAFPHHITIDLGTEYDVSGLQYVRRQNNVNSVFKDYEVFVSTDGVTWGEPVATGSFSTATTPQNVALEVTRGRYVKLVGLNSLAGNAFGGAAEINIGGTLPGTSLDVSTVASTRCIAGKVYVSAKATNSEDVPLALTIESAYGTKSFASVAPGKSAVHAFTTRAADVPAGTVTFDATATIDGASVTTSIDAAYDAATCQ
ncbi:family 20 glycosylhydrolase [Agromyces laixinhei]|uniref:family 20 glycosylhydrolase n=1 Tax=Agromyces laixinhei TaxID=2585717 RepID=UPI001115D428|nr:family 20 glycosylhydrolase [Agromyces laixinhei]